MQREAKSDADGAMLRERIGSRKGWGDYVVAMTKVRRSVVGDADRFLADMHARLRQALERTSRG